MYNLYTSCLTNSSWSFDRQTVELTGNMFVLFSRSMFFKCLFSELFSMEEQGNQIIAESKFNQRDAFRESWFLPGFIARGPLSEGNTFCLFIFYFSAIPHCF